MPYCHIDLSARQYILGTFAVMPPELPSSRVRRNIWRDRALFERGTLIPRSINDADCRKIHCRMTAAGFAMVNSAGSVMDLTLGDRVITRDTDVGPLSPGQDLRRPAARQHDLPTSTSGIRIRRGGRCKIAAISITESKLPEHDPSTKSVSSTRRTYRSNRLPVRPDLAG